MQTANQNDIDSVLLSKTVTVKQYRLLESQQDKSAIAKFIYDRFMERYISPLNSTPTDNKHGFNIMASCCLMIEAFESFRCGYQSTRGKSKDCFQSFFQYSPRFIDFSTVSTEFYSHVRCGILHQTETTGGWRITRKGNSPVFDKATLTINASKFLNRLGHHLEDYTKELETSDWNDEIWMNLRRKMAAVIKNCEREITNVH